MFTTVKSRQTASPMAHSDWDFLSHMFSGTVGIIIGWAIALGLGWV